MNKAAWRNYLAAVEAYREMFGTEPSPEEDREMREDAGL